MTLSVSLPALATTSHRPLGERVMADACRPQSRAGVPPATSGVSPELLGRRDACPTFLERSTTDTEPSLEMKRTGSTRTSMPWPAGPVVLRASGRRPPQLLT